MHERYQNWRETGAGLVENANLAIPELRNEVAGELSDSLLYSYVMTSVEMHDGRLLQCGTGPNVEGDVLTLCTCKHYMRTWSAIEEGTWIAGLTSRADEFAEANGHCLFYLSQIESVHETYPELGNYLTEEFGEDALDVKKTSNNPLGDFYEFDAREAHSTDDDLYYDPDRYKKPVDDHDHNGSNDGWREDIDKKYDRTGRPKLVVGDPSRTYVWDEPSISYMPEHYRGAKKWKGFDEFFECLEMVQIDESHDNTSSDSTSRRSCNPSTSRNRGGCS